ncbi:hypothetical protein MMC27_003697 [Xylographa pallens]|nr:hypothetical protein [Xylographa pallens]
MRANTQQDITDREIGVQASLLASTTYSKATVESSSSQHSATSRKSRRSEDEQQLLGYNANEYSYLLTLMKVLPADFCATRIDPDAVFISIPTSRPRAEAMPVPSGGVIPMNTLTQHNQPQSTIALVKNGAGRVIGKFGSLVTSAISGNNVQSFSLREPLSEVFVETRASKRQKITHTTQPQKFQLVEEIDSNDDGDDVLSKGPARVQILRQINGRAAPSMSLTSSTTTSRPSVLRQVSNEHRRLEEMMNSDRYAQTRGRPPKVASKLQPRSNGTPSIDLTESDSVPKPPYKGTVRPSGQSGHTRDPNFKQRVYKTTLSDTRSKFFTDSSHAQDDSGNLSPSKGSAQLSDVHPSSQTRNLNDTFIAVDGLRRNSQSAFSSDELAATSPIGDYASVSRLSPQKQSRRASHSPRALDKQRSLPPPAKSAPLESSNIKPIKFTDSVSKPNKMPRTHSNRKSTRSVDGFECCAIVIDSFYLDNSQHGLGLVSNDTGESFDIHHNGQNLSEQNTCRYIPLLKVARAIWSPDSSVMQLVFSRGGEYPSKVAVKFASHKLASNFLHSIQKPQQNLRIIQQKGSHMDKLFINSKKEAENCASIKNNTIKSRDPELELLEKRKQQRDEKGSSASDNEEADSKRRRRDHRISDRFEGNKNIAVDQLGLEDPLIKSNRLVSDQLTYSDERLSAPHLHTNIDRIMSDILKTSDNPRTTRSKASSGRILNPPQGISLLVEEFPEELRYSKTHGHGKRWKNPLIFPQNGKKKTTVEYDDLERLDDGQFLNDNLLGFYLRYLEYHLEDQRPDIAKKVYWFNTYFFASLTQTVKGKRGINYEAVRKWTRNIDVFTYDYAVVPINESAHWYVAIICNLRALNRMPDAEGGEEHSSPQSEKFEALDEFEAEVSECNSAVPEDEELKKTQEATINIHKSEDEDATESFADLQLSEKEDKSLPQNDKDIIPEGRSSPRGLFKRVHAPDPMPPLLQQSKPQTLGAETDSIVVTGEPIGRTPVSQKKGKRKSIPSPRVFDPEQPAIITLDSLGIAHSPTIRVLKDYLREEAKDKRGGMVFDDSQIKGITVKQIPLQDNFCDCGLFLLGYMEKFVEDPRDFVTKVLQREFDPTKDWPKLNPTVMRVTLRDLVQELHSKQEDRREHPKRNSVAKASDEEAKIEQETSASLTRNQTLPITNGVEDEKLSAKDVGPKANERGDNPPSSRRVALQTALLIDEPDPLPIANRKQANNGPEQPHSSSTTPSTITTNAPIVLDSQESVAPERSPDILAADSAQTEPVELPMEIPESPTRPTTRGKPSPGPEFRKTTTSSKRKLEPTDGMRIPRDRRQVISLSDS